MERRAPAQSLSRDQCTQGPSSRNNMNTIAVQVLLMHLFHTLYTRYVGIAHHRALQTSRRGWADSKAVHGMECNGGTHALLASWKVRAFSLCLVFTSSRLPRVVPHGTKGTGPEFVTRPVYSRS